MVRYIRLPFFCLFMAIGFCYLLPKGVNRHVENRFEENENEALDALQSINLWRAYPNKDFPADAYTRAYDFYRAHFKNAMNKTATGSWRSLGPNNVGGRTIAIAIDPKDTNIIWLGSAGGGLWKSTSGGIGTNAWEYISTGFPVQAVSSILIDPTNSKVMYIGTGETYSYGSSTMGLIAERTTRGTYGLGILKTTDGGKTWKKSLDWSLQQNRGIWKIAVNPLNTKILYAATTEGVYKSKDSGATWVNVLAQKMVMDIFVHKTDTATIFAGVGNLNSANKGIYRTSNSGASWTVLTNGLPTNTRTGRITLAPYAKNNDIIVADISNMYADIGRFTSTDKGKTWTQTDNQDIMSYQGWYCKGLMIKSDDSSTILAGGVYPYIQSGGASTMSYLNSASYIHSDIHDIISNPLDANKIYIICDGGLYRSDDFGNTAYVCNDGYITSQFYIGSSSTTDSGYAIGGLQDNYTYQFNASPYWNALIGGDGCYNAINPKNDQTQYGAWQYLNVLKTTDQWNVQNTQILSNTGAPDKNNGTGFLAPYILSPADTGVMYAGGDSLLYSNDGGNSFSIIGQNNVDSGNYIMAIAGSSTYSDSIYFTTAPVAKPRTKVFRSGDHGKTITDITKGLPNRFPRRMAVNPKNSKEVFIVYAGFGTGHIFKSTNAGTTWADVSTSLPDVPFHCILVDPYDTNILFAGCDIALFVSVDGGTSWNAFDQGLPDANMVFDLVISRSNKSLLAFTHGHGVFTRPLSDLTGNIVGIKNNKLLDESINIFPVPANDHITIQSNDNIPLTEDIFIYSISGKIVLCKHLGGLLGSGRVSIDVHSLPPGTYFLTTTIDKKAITKKILIMRD